jgi:hypothetical protein
VNKPKKTIKSFSSGTDTIFSGKDKKYLRATAATTAGI